MSNWLPLLIVVSWAAPMALLVRVSQKHAERTNRRLAELEGTQSKIVEILDLTFKPQLIAARNAKLMAQRTLYTCDKCHTEHDSGQKGDFPIEYQWSLAQRLGVDVFMLCGTCTTALVEFIGLPRLPTVAPTQDVGQQP